MSNIIYAITHLPTGKVYVGTTAAYKTELVNNAEFGLTPRRFVEHLASLSAKRHHNADLQGSWAGTKEHYEFQVLAHVPDGTNPFSVETRFIRAYPEVFNLRKTDKLQPSFKRLPAETREAIVADLRSGMLGKAVAAKHGVSEASVTCIRQEAGLPRGNHRLPEQRKHVPLYKQMAERPVLRTDGRVNYLATLRAHDLLGHKCARGFMDWHRKQATTQAVR